MPDMTNRTFGEISLQKDATGAPVWVISRMEPHVIIRFKHMFPRIAKTAVPPFTLPRDSMIEADLWWFMLRYALAISTADRRLMFKGDREYRQQQSEMETILLPTHTVPQHARIREGQILRRYQSQAVELLRRRRSLLCGDEGGLGKTYTAAAFLATEPASLPAAVVCDPHMCLQWAGKTSAFTTLTTHVVKQGTPYDLPPADIYIFTFSKLNGWGPIFTSGFFRSVVYDEPQSLRRGTETAKGKAAAILSKHVLYRLGLTATPIYNLGSEMFEVMQFIDNAVLGSREDFHREWVKADGTIADPKALGTFLREQHAMLRRLKSDVGLELPKVSRIVEYVDHDAKAVASIEDLARKLAIKASTGDYLERGRAARELDIMVRQATGVSKAKSVAQFVRLMVEAGEPVIVAGWHREVWRILCSELDSAGIRWSMYTGSESDVQKNHAKEQFIAGGTDVLLLSLRSGAGIDGLQHRCSVVVFAELDWSPGIHQQVIWRIDREGQNKPVTAFFLVSEDGSDPPVMDRLGIKSSEAQQIVDPHLGLQKANDDMSNLRRLVNFYLAKMGKPLVQDVDIEVGAAQDALELSHQA